MITLTINKNDNNNKEQKISNITNRQVLPSSLPLDRGVPSFFFLWYIHLHFHSYNKNNNDSFFAFLQKSSLPWITYIRAKWADFNLIQCKYAYLFRIVLVVILFILLMILCFYVLSMCYFYFQMHFRFVYLFSYVFRSNDHWKRLEIG